jgi:hypothetical protein
LKEAIKQDKRRVSSSEKLSAEIINVLKNKPCYSLKLKKNNKLKASQNRSNIYYR